MPGKISELAVLTGATAATGDLVEVVDISDTSMAVSGTNKKLTLSGLSTVAGGGLEGAKPTSPATPMRYFAIDTKRDWLYDGTGWIVMAEPTTAYTPATNYISYGTGGTTSASYHRSDGWCDVSIFTGFGTASAGVITAAGPTWTVPFIGDSAASATQAMGSVTMYDATGSQHALTPYMQNASLIEPRISVVNGVYVSGLGQISNTVPITIAVNDYIRIKIRYCMSSRYS